MKIKMTAIAPFDGWAFIREEGNLYLLRPPYHSKDLIEASEKDISNAVQKYGFHECDFDFNSIPETVHFLKDKYVEAMKKQGVSLPGKEQLMSLLRHATDDVLWDYLEKADKEFIPQRNLDAAESIAVALMRVEKVKKNEKMFNKALYIIDRVREERTKLKNYILDSTMLKHKFPNAEKKYSRKSILEIMSFTYKSKQLLPVGA